VGCLAHVGTGHLHDASAEDQRRKPSRRCEPTGSATAPTLWLSGAAARPRKASGPGHRSRQATRTATPGQRRSSASHDLRTLPAFLSRDLGPSRDVGGRISLVGAP
jgi:hypothetical protein